MDLDNKIIALRAQDIQTGLQGVDQGDFENLLLAGMAARLAIHLRGSKPIPFEIIKKFVHPLFGIPPLLADRVLRVLAEVEYVSLVTEGRTIRTIIPRSVPYYDDLYQGIGEYTADMGLNELETLSLEMVERLAKCPQPLHNLLNDLGADTKAFTKVIAIGEAGSYISKIAHKRGDFLLTPLYFAESGDAIVQAVASTGAASVGRVLQLLRKHPGWPLKLTLSKKRIGDSELSSTEVSAIRLMLDRSSVQPPAITTCTETNHFLFTPVPGCKKIPIVEKDIYEKSMAIVACIRQGEHFSSYRIENPAAIAGALKYHGWLREFSEAREQYANLVIAKVARFEGNRLVILDIPEAKQAVELAYEMITGGQVERERPADEERVRILSGGHEYMESLRGLGKIRHLDRVRLPDDAAKEEMDAVLEALQFGG